MCHAYNRRATEMTKYGWSNPNVFTVYKSMKKGRSIDAIAKLHTYTFAQWCIMLTMIRFHRWCKQDSFTQNSPGTFCPLYSNEQDQADQTLPHWSCLSSRPAKDDSGAIPGVLSMCKKTNRCLQGSYPIYCMVAVIARWLSVTLPVFL